MDSKKKYTRPGIETKKIDLGVFGSYNTRGGKQDTGRSAGGGSWFSGWPFGD